MDEEEEKEKEKEPVIEKEKPPEEPKLPPKEKIPKPKSAEDKLWQECSALGRKLDDMATHGVSIVAQTKEANNEWCWAENYDETKELQAQLDKFSQVIHRWSSSVRTSALATLTKKQGSEEAAIDFLQILKTDIEEAAKGIEAPLGVLVAMHSTMLKKRFVSAPRKKAQKKQKQV